MKQYSKEEKEKWVEGWRKSGKKPWTYAKENGLIPQTFIYWARGKTPGNTFVEVKRAVVKQAAGVSEIIIEKGGLKIHIPSGFERQELEAVIQALGE